MAFVLRITDAGRAALADGNNRGTNAITLTKMAIGSGQGPGGEADDGRTALRTLKETVALTGSSMVAGRIAVRGEFNPAEAYGVSELGLLGQVGAGAEELYAYWTDGGALLASTVDGTRLVIAGTLDIAPAAAEVTVTVDASISLGDPALSATVTAVSGRVDALENADFGVGLMAAMQARAALDTRLDALEGADFGALIAALTGRVTTLEAGGDSVIQSIQRGVVTPVNTGTVTVTLASVDVSKSVVNLLTSIGSASGDRKYASLRLTGATELSLTTAFWPEDISYEVIEYQ